MPGARADPRLYDRGPTRVPAGRRPARRARLCCGASSPVHTRPETCSAGIAGVRHDARFRTRRLHRGLAAGPRLPVPAGASRGAGSPRHARRFHPQVRRIPHRRRTHRRREQDAARNPHDAGRARHHGDRRTGGVRRRRHEHHRLLPCSRRDLLLLGSGRRHRRRASVHRHEGDSSLRQRCAEACGAARTRGREGVRRVRADRARCGKRRRQATRGS